MRALRWLGFTWMLANVVDIVETLYGISHGMEEQNPLMAFWLKYGVFSFVGFKMMMAALIMAYCVWKERASLLVTANILLWAVVAWNAVGLHIHGLL